MTPEQRQTLVTNIDNDVRAYMAKRMLGAKDPGEVIAALCQCFIFQGVQCGLQLHDEERMRDILKEFTEMTFKKLKEQKAVKTEEN